MSGAGFTIRSVAHTGITVTDLEVSIRFWTEVLQFRVERRFELSGDFAAKVTGVSGAHITAAVLAGAGHRIELLQYLQPSHRSHMRPRPCDVGSLHLAVDVDDLMAVTNACAKYGWSVAGEPQTMLEGPRAGTRFAYLHDEDGLTLELIEEATR